MFLCRGKQRFAALRVLSSLLKASAIAADSTGAPQLQSKAGSLSSSWSRGGWQHSSREEDLGFGSTWDLYSLQATEQQQQHYLQAVAAMRSAADAAVVAEKVEELEQGTDDPPSDPLEAARIAAEELAAETEVCEEPGTCPDEPDFYETSADFREEHQLVLRSTWLCAGASSLASMREQLEKRIRFLEDLEADGWQLEEPVDDQYACLHNPQPKPRHERRLPEAWSIAEQWELGVDWERWLGRYD